MKLLLALIPCITLIACSVQPSVQPLVSEAPESSGLNQVKQTGFDSFFINSNAKGLGYHSIMFDELQLEELVIDDARLDIRDRDWSLTDKDKERWQAMFQKRVSLAFSKPNSLSLTESPAEGVLKAQFELVNFTPSASKDEPASRINSNKIYTRSVGKLDIRVIISDSITGKRMAYIEDSREVGDNSYPILERNNRINNDRKMRLELSSWLNLLKTALVDLAS